MVKIRPFRGIRPQPALAARVSALPYDVMSRAEARRMAAANPYSILHVTRADIDCDDAVAEHDPAVYEQAAANLQRFFDQNILMREDKPVYYIYRQIMAGRAQTGLVAAVSVEDYRRNIVKKHELTRKDKEEDRIRHFQTLRCQTEPVFLAYRQNDAATTAMANWTAVQQPLYDFTSSDDVRHQLWLLDDEPLIAAITDAFGALPALYIADGHHRTASAAAVGQGTEATVMAVIFPAAELTIMAYNRVVKDKNGLTAAEILAKLSENFTVTVDVKDREVKEKYQFLMILDGRWYLLQAKPALYEGLTAAERSDAAILQNVVLAPLFGIDDPRTDPRIDFVGGIRGSEEVAARSEAADGIGFVLCPVTIAEIMAIADAGNIMFPKSTWFEPKLRSGLFLCDIPSL